MSRNTIRQCDVCESVMPDTARRLELKATLTIVNGRVRESAIALPDICSEKCLHDALNALTRKVDAA